MIIYIDNSYNCHSEDDGARRAFYVPYFNGKCPAYIEGHLYVPEGEKLVLASGFVLEGEAITTTEDYSLLMVAQSKYERQELERLGIENADYEAALSEIEETLGV